MQKGVGRFWLAKANVLAGLIHPHAECDPARQQAQNAGLRLGG